ncbi:hypothetical protein MMA38_23715, partial [Salmonella enterica]|nr:hypothetical protein [Salmonella enterica]
ANDVCSILSDGKPDRDQGGQFRCQRITANINPGPSVYAFGTGSFGLTLTQILTHFAVSPQIITYSQ